MRVGLSLPHYGFSFPDGSPLTWDAVADAARRAEDLGFDSAWISDHFFLDLSRYGGDGLSGSVEAFTTLAALAQLTDRMRLGTLVTCAPFRHPAHVAKMATTIDLATGGRFDLGLGAGWYEGEFRAFGYPFPSTGERLAILEDTVRAVAALFAGGPVDLETPTVRLHRAFNHPVPAREGGPPLWIGGKGGPRVLRLVARHADGWNAVWRWTPDAHRERSADLRRIAEEEGRDPDGVRLSVGLYTVMGEDARDLEARWRRLQRWAPGASLDGMTPQAFATDTLTGTPDACLDRLGSFAEHGVEEVIVAPASLPFAVSDWSTVELVAGSLIADAHRL
jgi:alkanesulfonate monooxygenase SsuD/methylene tetrahydromethanopterin reductase-like flavin-dependent oxidoreductase (luciferase family)